MKSYIEIDFTEKNKPHKRFNQTLLYKSSKVIGNVLMLCGPDLESHLKDGKLIAVDKQKNIDIYELDRPTYLSNLKDKSNIKFNIPVNIINDNILIALNTKKKYRFIDLDLCRTLDTTLDTVETTFNYLKNLKGKSGTLNKHILVTFSGMRKNRQKDINKLCDLFNIKNDFVKDDFMSKLYLYKSKSSNACYINYRDGMPMCTFSYQFK